MRRTLAGLTLAFALTALPAAAQEASGFDPVPFLGQGDAYNCANFASQADAQAVLGPTRPTRTASTRIGTASPASPTAHHLTEWLCHARRCTCRASLACASCRRMPWLVAPHD